LSEVVPAHKTRPRALRTNLYVYAVLSRRAEGVSIGVNLSPHKGCNFDCSYCQVDRRTPATVKTVDLAILRDEIRDAFDAAKSGDLFVDQRFAGTPKSMLVLADVAFAGDGEPTNEPWFADAARVVAEERTRAGLTSLPFRIITNATVFHQPKVAETLRFLDAHGLDVWAKLDAGTEAYYLFVDRTRVPFRRVLDNLLLCAKERPTTIQSLFARHHGEPPSDAEIAAWAERLRELRAGGATIPWVQVHTVSRPPAESWVQPLTMDELEKIAAAARAALPGARVVAYRGSA
jgi:wyosine [tRNA(Phe)-imidazoG37] synthetase (radical SAM superfamily)